MGMERERKRRERKEEKRKRRERKEEKRKRKERGLYRYARYRIPYIDPDRRHTFLGKDPIRVP